MRRAIFGSPQEAESAFYDAFQKADLDAMMDVWAEDEDVCCVHPAGPRLTSIEDIRESWRAIFSGSQGLRVQLRNAIQNRGALLAVHSVHEMITAPGERPGRNPVVATNVYMNTASGWRMIVHHASPIAGSPRETRPPETPPPVLH